jgi:hypothetical protein
MKTKILGLVLAMTIVLIIITCAPPEYDLLKGKWEHVNGDYQYVFDSEQITGRDFTQINTFPEPDVQVAKGTFDVVANNIDMSYEVQGGDVIDIEQSVMSTFGVDEDKLLIAPIDAVPIVAGGNTDTLEGEWVGVYEERVAGDLIVTATKTLTINLENETISYSYLREEDGNETANDNHGGKIESINFNSMTFEVTNSTDIQPGDDADLPNGVYNFMVVGNALIISQDEIKYYEKLELE